MASKKQLIDANDVYSLFDVNGMARLHVGDIDVIPRVDAVEVVRCKDCQHHEHYDTLLYCGHSRGLAGSVSPDDFCSCGERKYNGC